MFGNRFSFYFLIISTTLTGVDFIPFQPTYAREITERQEAFTTSPRLIRSATTFLQKNNSVARYQFTIEVPKNSGETLKSIKVTQKQNVETVVFNPNKTRAALGNNISGIDIPLAATGGESKPGEITVVFDKPIEPGNTVTISVKPRRNPSVGGVYLFGITAYPTEGNSGEVYLGSGRIHISQD
jgi:hypothetical protein